MMQDSLSSLSLRRLRCVCRVLASACLRPPRRVKSRPRPVGAVRGLAGALVTQVSNRDPAAMPPPGYVRAVRDDALPRRRSRIRTVRFLGTSNSIKGEPGKMRSRFRSLKPLTAMLALAALLVGLIVAVAPVSANAAGTNLALGKAVSVSSTNSSYIGTNINDG